MMLIHEAVFVIGLIEEVESDIMLWKNIIGIIHSAVISPVKTIT